MKKREGKSLAGIVAVLLAVAILSSAFSVAAFAAGPVKYTDVSGHWAEKTIVKAANDGLDMLTGDKFEPDVAITREEFCHMLNWAFGLTTKANTVGFQDVDRSGKYYDDIRIGVYSDYIHGVDQTHFKPTSNITREQAMQIFYNILPLYGVSATGTAEKFTDYKEIDRWALAPVGTITNAGYVKGYPDGTVKPLKNITKAEALVMITRVVESQYIVHSDFTAKDGDVFKDTIFTGTIYVPAGVRVTFDNCSILGKLVSGTTQAQTKWELTHDTKVANFEYTENSTPSIPSTPVTPGPGPVPSTPEEPEIWPTN